MQPYGAVFEEVADVFAEKAVVYEPCVKFRRTLDVECCREQHKMVSSAATAGVCRVCSGERQCAEYDGPVFHVAKNSIIFVIDTNIKHTEYGEG